MSVKKAAARRGTFFNKVSSHLESGEVEHYYGLKKNKITQVEIQDLIPIYIRKVNGSTYEIVTPSYTHLTLQQLENNVLVFKMNTDCGLKKAFEDIEKSKKPTKR